MTEYLNDTDVLDIAAYALGFQPVVRDHGLLLSACARAQSTVFGQDAYPGIYEKAAALLHSLARNHALQDGNKRTAWASAATFLDLNGHELIELLDLNKSERMVLDAAQGLIDIEEIAAVLASMTT